MISERDFPHEPYSADTLEQVAIVEALPYSRAFEHLMYGNRIKREVEYAMDEPIQLSPMIMEGKFSEELRGIFPEASYEISDLRATQTETDSLDASGLDVSFLADGAHHGFTIYNDKMTYRTLNSSNETVEYALDKTLATSFLSSLVYARQISEESPLLNIELVENPIQTPRDSLITMNEQLLLTLGHHDGKTSIRTTALFDTGDQMLVATLIEGEQPRMSNIISKLELAELDFNVSSPKTEEIILHQNSVNIKATPGVLENRFAERLSQHESELIDPDENFEEWSKICVKFLKNIDKPLASFSHLDE